VSLIKRIAKTIVSELFPENYQCISCDDELNSDKRYGLCDNCMNVIKFIKDRACIKCGALVIADSKVCSDCKKIARIIDKNYSSVLYEGKIRKIIHGLKYDNKKYYAKYLGKILYDKFVSLLKEYEPDIIIPVPISQERMRVRGYNQVELLLDEFETHKEIIDCQVMVRVVDTPFQATLRRDDRMENLKGAFKLVDTTKLLNKKVLVVDDIFTTGATLDESARLIYSAGAKEVRGLTLVNSHFDKPIED